MNAAATSSAPLSAAEGRDPVLEFRFAKRMTYRDRMRWIAGLVAVGLVLQVAFLSALAGLPLLVAAVVLGWVVGYDNRLDRRGLKADAAWRTAPFEKIGEIVRLDRSMRDWDRSAFDVSCAPGFLCLLLALGLVAAAFGVTFAVAGAAAAGIVAADGWLLIVPVWFTGMRSVHRRPDLVLKAGHITSVVAATRAEIDAAGKLAAQLLMGDKGGETSPTDARITIAVADPPGKMLTVQGQVVLNRVQGTPYPYFYCVVVAGKGEGLLRAAGGKSRGSEITIEPKSEGDVDIVVVRQTTTKTSGYHTKPKQSADVLRAALDVAVRFRDAARQRVA